MNGHTVTVIAGHQDIGARHGAFHFLRLLQTGQSIDHIDLRESPRMKLRLPSGLPLPPDYAPPPHSRRYYESLSFPYVPGFSSW